MRSSALAWAVTLSLWCGPAASFSISPTHAVIDASLPRPVTLVVSAGNMPLAVELSALERHASASRESLRAPAAGTLDIRPSQVLLAAGQSAHVTVRWLAGPAGSASRSFYVLAEELPVKLQEGAAASELRVLTRFHLPLHVRGTGAPAVTVHRTSADRFTLANTGQQFVRLGDVLLKLSARSSGAVRTIPGGVLARAAQVDALLPGRVLEFDAGSVGLHPDEEVVGLVARD